MQQTCSSYFLLCRRMDRDEYTSNTYSIWHGHGHRISLCIALSNWQNVSFEFLCHLQGPSLFSKVQKQNRNQKKHHFILVLNILKTSLVSFGCTLLLSLQLKKKTTMVATDSLLKYNNPVLVIVNENRKSVKVSVTFD